MKDDIRYKNDSYTRELILSIKTGEVRKLSVIFILHEQENVVQTIKRGYKEQEKNKELEKHLKDLVKEHTLKHLGL